MLQCYALGICVPLLKQILNHIHHTYLLNVCSDIVTLLTFEMCNIVLGDKMNLTVRLGELFYESSTGVPALLPCSHLPRQEMGTVRKLFT